MVDPNDNIPTIQALTMVTLREYFEMRLEAQNHALELAARALETRLDSMNEFREQLRDQAARLLTRAEFDLVHTRVTDDIKTLREFKSAVDAKASTWSVFFVGGLAVIGMIISLVTVLKRDPAPQAAPSPMAISAPVAPTRPR